MSGKEKKEEATQEFKIAEGPAKEQFQSLLDYFDISFEDIEIEDGPEAALTMKNFIVRSIMRGRLEVLSEDGLKVIHRLSKPTENTSEITYTDKVAKAQIAKGKITKKGEDQARQDAFMSVLSGIPSVEFSNLRGADYALYRRISTVFSLV